MLTYLLFVLKMSGFLTLVWVMIKGYYYVALWMFQHRAQIFDTLRKGVEFVIDKINDISDVLGNLFSKDEAEKEDIEALLLVHKCLYHKDCTK